MSVKVAADKIIVILHDVWQVVFQDIPKNVTSNIYISGFNSYIYHLLKLSGTLGKCSRFSASVFMTKPPISQSSGEECVC